ncbi:MAG: hypothetical protein JSW38_03850 [Dehalococcoidia bacterium]|nr:MAG: hypothetical protein JSW38_03850 [Dehalococcoidia bacterium]
MVFVVSGGFWIAYGGTWYDYIKVGLIPFATLVPSGVWDYSDALAFAAIVAYWVVFLAVVYAAGALVSRSGLKRKKAAYIGIAVFASFIYAGCYWLTAQAIAAAVSVFLLPTL